MAGITPEMREARHEQLKSTTSGAVKAALERLLAEGLAHAPVCVVSSRAMLEQANAELAGNALAISEILQAR